MYEGVYHSCIIDQYIRNANLHFFWHVLEPRSYVSQSMDIIVPISHYNKAYLLTPNFLVQFHRWQGPGFKVSTTTFPRDCLFYIAIFLIFSDLPIPPPNLPCKNFVNFVFSKCRYTKVFLYLISALLSLNTLHSISGSLDSSYYVYKM